TNEEKRVLALWPENVTNKTLRSAKKRLRFQLGQADKYLAGLERSGAWKEYIVKTLKDMGLPTEISSLPHVESSFNPKAYSKVGAAGMWQFTRSTGRRFMRIDHVVDERMDVFKATISAARLLENNYSVTGTWPLALTAYNHGAAGMRNAARRMGTTDIVTILRKYNCRSFKFASRNFYVAFLAAVEVEENAEKYFGQINFNPPIVDDIVKIPAYMAITDIQKALGLPMSEIREKNPALRPPVWSGQKLVPRGYELRLAQGSVQGGVETAIARIAALKQYAKQKPDRYHKVRRGQTLSTIARRYGVSVKDIVAVNNLRSRNTIRVGQVLRLPQPEGSSTQYASLSNSKSIKSKNNPVSLPDDGLYTVRKGDSIHRIAKRYGVSEKQIIALNDFRRANRIYPGQVLRIKTAVEKESTATPVTTVTNQEKKTTKPVQVAMVEPTSEDSQKDTDVPANDASNAEAAKEQSEITSTGNDANEQETSASDANSESSAIPAAKSTAEDNTVADTDSPQGLPKLPPVIEDVPPLPDLVVAKVDEDQNALEDANPTAIVETLDEAIENVDAGTIAEEIEQENQENLDLAADPSDYSVANNNTIEVQAAETLGHYAEWLDTRASRLRRLNRMRYGNPVVIGKRIKLDFSKVNHDEFERRRKDYHQALQEDFFTQYEITGSEQHVIRRGDSLWKLAKRKFKVPMWLLRQYNPDLNINNVRRGTVVTFPRIEERVDKEATSTQDEMIATTKTATDPSQPSKVKQ
ncbi:LysM peptidoglycan-binding domain-containing protein, partial [Kaarinaea lacus]